MTLGPITYDNSLSTFTNNVDISGRLNVAGNLNVSGSTTVSAFSATGDTFIDGNVTIANLTVTEVLSTNSSVDLTVQSSLSAYGEVYFAGNDTDTPTISLSSLNDVTPSFNYDVLLTDKDTDRLHKIPVSNFGNYLPGMIVPYYISSQTTLATSDGGLIGDINDAATDPAIVAHPSSVDFGVDYSWAVCNGAAVGSFTTPDLRNRFIIGAADVSSTTDVVDTDGTVVNYNLTAGETGGTTAANTGSLTLYVDSVPNHYHLFDDNAFFYNTYFEQYNGAGALQRINESTAGNLPTEQFTKDSSGNTIFRSRTTADPRGSLKNIDTMPPYFSLYYLVKLPLSVV